MSEQQKQLVRTSWAKVTPTADVAADMFFKRLFELDPSLQPLFKSDIRQQGIKLMAMISRAVAALDNFTDVTPTLQALGRRHVGYGVKPEHYATVGAAFLWTLEQRLGSENWNNELKEAWGAIYTILATTMQSAPAEAPAT